MTGTDQVATKVTARDGTSQSVTTTVTSMSQQLVLAAARRVTVSGQCNSQPTRSREKGLANAGVCQLGDATGAFSRSFSCKTPATGGAEFDCVGEIGDGSGAYATSIEYGDMIAIPR